MCGPSNCPGPTRSPRESPSPNPYPSLCLANCRGSNPAPAPGPSPSLLGEVRAECRTSRLPCPQRRLVMLLRWRRFSDRRVRADFCARSMVGTPMPEDWPRPIASSPRPPALPSLWSLFCPARPIPLPSLNRLLARCAIAALRPRRSWCPRQSTSRQYCRGVWEKTRRHWTRFTVPRALPFRKRSLAAACSLSLRSSTASGPLPNFSITSPTRPVRPCMRPTISPSWRHSRRCPTSFARRAL